MTGHQRALAISALVLSAARKQPRGVFTISGDRSNYDDGRRDLISMREHFAEHAEDYNRAVFPGRLARVTRQEAAPLEVRPYDLVYLDPPYAPPSDDNCYIKRFHFLQGVSRYWQGDTLMMGTRTRNRPKPVTGYSNKRTIVEAVRDTFKRYRDAGAIVLSYGSNALPDVVAGSRGLKRVRLSHVSLSAICAGGGADEPRPDGIASELVQIVAAHVRYRQGADAQVLLTRLRKAIAPHVAPAVLDDVVLFLNETRYRSS